ncbi:hypothetical protein [Gordonia amicalis]|uniref:hypothetical protein n=1 Tax=Gordonia amicalis TaxID=89053 RepID=UPI0002A649AA|nr:hypothetical protein [Gordonia amicalis]NKX78662.1 hypothetical protein [Gordonia amicalis]GAC55544.1 hypothetical protein GOAMI_57_00110 [Gordonia amicalis NBRC 100051 = JCM 11271]
MIDDCDEPGRPLCDSHRHTVGRMISRASKSPATARQLRDSLDTGRRKGYRELVAWLVADRQPVEGASRMIDDELDAALDEMRAADAEWLAQVEDINRACAADLGELLPGHGTE